MAGEYLTIRGSGKGEYTVKKSRFLGLALHVESEEEAAGYLEKIRKQYRVSCVSAQEVSEAFDRLLDCLNDLKGEIASEISDF